MASTIWRGYITFGLISVPVRLFRAARAERVSFRRMYRASPGAGVDSADEPDEDDAPAPTKAAQSGLRLEAAKTVRPISGPGPAAAVAVPEPRAEPVLIPARQVSVREGTGDVVPAKAIVKGYEYEKDRFVAIDAEELKSIAPKTATQMEIQEFVSLAEVDPVYFETSYYVKPEEAGEKAYALLFKALQSAGLVAVAQFAMHNREHVVVVRPSKKGLIAHTMFFSSEVRAEEEYRADVDAVSPKELQLAEMLVHSLSAPFEPEKYRDTYREKIEEIIAKKVAGQPVDVQEAPSRSSSVVDITDALQRSLAALKKPAAKEQVVPPAEAETKKPPVKRAARKAGTSY